jgi:hypothetical protein
MYENKDSQGREEWSGKEMGQSLFFFHSPFVFTFVHFLMDNVNAFWFEVAPNLEMSHPR